MPALPPVARVLKTVVNFQINSVPCVNVFHILYAGGAPTNTQANAIASSVHSFWSQNFIVNVHPSLLLENVTVQDLSSPLGAQGIHAVSIPGTATGSPLPASAAVVGSWKIANRYRGGKPRTYMSGLVQGDLQDAQTLTAQAVSAFNNAFTGFMNSVNGLATPAGVGPFVLGCVHYKSGGNPIANPTFDPFVAVQVSNTVRSQRGRLSAG